MTAARRLAAILAADVGVREHRDGTSENRANGTLYQRSRCLTDVGPLAHSDWCRLKLGRCRRFSDRGRFRPLTPILL